jgi:hypothetical protein
MGHSFVATGLRLISVDINGDLNFYSCALSAQIFPTACSKFHTSYAGVKKIKTFGG